MLSAVIPSERSYESDAPGGTTDTQCPFGPDEFWLGVRSAKLAFSLPMGRCEWFDQLGPLT